MLRSILVLALLTAVVAGCQGNEPGVYNEQARDEARRIAGLALFSGEAEDTSVGPVRETRDCPESPSRQPGPCLAMEVTTNVPTRDPSGKTGQRVMVSFDAFVWLQRNGAGRWVVSDKLHRPSGATLGP